MPFVKEHPLQHPASFCYYGYEVPELSKTCFVTEPIIVINKPSILWYFSVSVVASRDFPQGPFEVPEHHT